MLMVGWVGNSFWWRSLPAVTMNITSYIGGKPRSLFFGILFQQRADKKINTSILGVVSAVGFKAVIASFLTNKSINAEKWVLRVWSRTLKPLLVCVGVRRRWCWGITASLQSWELICLNLLKGRDSYGFVLLMLVIYFIWENKSSGNRCVEKTSF